MIPGDTLTRHEPAKTNEEAGGHPLPLSLAEHQTRASGWPSRSLAHQGVRTDFGNCCILVALGRGENNMNHRCTKPAQTCIITHKAVQFSRFYLVEFWTQSTWSKFKDQGLELIELRGIESHVVGDIISHSDHKPRGQMLVI